MFRTKPCFKKDNIKKKVIVLEKDMVPNRTVFRALIVLITPGLLNSFQ